MKVEPERCIVFTYYIFSADSGREGFANRPWGLALNLPNPSEFDAIVLKLLTSLHIYIYIIYIYMTESGRALGGVKTIEGCTGRISGDMYISYNSLHSIIL